MNRKPFVTLSAAGLVLISALAANGSTVDVESTRGGAPAAMRRYDGAPRTAAIKPVSYPTRRLLTQRSLLSTNSSVVAPAWNWANPKPQGFDFWGIATGGNVTVAVGNGGQIYTSTNNSNFTPQNSGTNLLLTSVTYGNGLFVAVGSNSMILTSSDGITWSQPVGPTSGFLNAVAYGGGLFIAVGSGPDYESSDGVTWTEITNLEALKTGTFTSVAFGNSEFVVVDNTGTSSSQLIYSSDGTTWTAASVTSPPNDSYTMVSYGGNPAVFSVVGGNITGSLIGDLTSSDGINWTVRSPTLDGNAITAPYFFDLTAGNNEIAALIVQYGGATSLATSTDGFSWDTRSVAPVYTDSQVIPFTLDWTGSDYLAAGASASIFGPDWVDISPVSYRTTYQRLRGTSWDGTQFVTVGDAGVVRYSPDGINWSGFDYGIVPPDFRAVADNGAIAVVVGA